MNSENQQPYELSSRNAIGLASMLTLKMDLLGLCCSRTSYEVTKHSIFIYLDFGVPGEVHFEKYDGICTGLKFHVLKMQENNWTTAAYVKLQRSEENTGVYFPYAIAHDQSMESRPITTKTVDDAFRWLAQHLVDET